MSPFTTVLLTVVLAAQPAPPGDWFRITVIDEQTGRPVPLVELETVHPFAITPTAMASWGTAARCTGTTIGVAG